MCIGFLINVGCTNRTLQHEIRSSLHVFFFNYRIQSRQ